MQSSIDTRHGDKTVALCGGRRVKTIIMMGSCCFAVILASSAALLHTSLCFPIPIG